MGVLIGLIIAHKRNRSLWHALWGACPCGWILMLMLLERGPPRAGSPPWYDRPIKLWR